MTAIKHTLAQGAVVDHYLILGELGSGGFSNVYVAKHLKSGEQVVVKEYMPRKLSARNLHGGMVEVTDANRSLFEKGKQLFMHEAKILVDIKHPNIVEVLNFFNANNTIYLVMRYEKGENLGVYGRKHGHLSEKFIDIVFPKVIDGVRAMHDKGLLHLDIKPENIHIRPGGNPILLDFGAVHPFSKSRKYHPGRILSKGFSPIEQYQEDGYVGPWSDVYALGATMRTCISGQVPADAETRHEKDRMKPLVKVIKKKYRNELLDAIDWALGVEPISRPQNVDALLDAMQHGRPVV